MGQCLKYEEKGEPHRYWGETSGSLYERGNQHLDEGGRCLPTSHIWQHLLLRHPEGLGDLRSNFRFSVVEKHSISFRRQIAECLLIKGSKYPVMKEHNKKEKRTTKEKYYEGGKVDKNKKKRKMKCAERKICFKKAERKEKEGRRTYKKILREGIPYNKEELMRRLK